MSSASEDKTSLVGYYRDQGIRLVRLKAADRQPLDTAWQDPEQVDHPPEEFEEHVRCGGGLGWQLGDISGGLSVVDNDWEIAMKLAPRFLLDTLRGAKGNEAPSHYAYNSPGLAYGQFNGLDGSRIIDVKASNNGRGHFVAVEPTVHPKKGPYQFVGGYNPAAIAHVEPEDLIRRIRLLAVASLVAANLPASREEGVGGRHDFGLALFGYMLRNGEPAEDVGKVAVAAWEVRGAPREALEDIRRSIPDTADRLSRGDEPVKGGPKLEEAIPGMTRKIAEFLGWKKVVSEGSGKPQVVINGRHLNEVTTDAMAAVIEANSPPQLFVRTGTIARITLDEDGVPEIQRLSEAALRGRMDRVADFVRVNKDKESEAVVPANPPKIVVEDAMALGSWDLPPIEAIVETPILRSDGTIFEEAGYDPETRLYHHPAPGFEMPAVSENPKPGEVDQALAIIDEAIGEFPFADTASAANARGLLLTPIIRQAIQGCVPLGLIDKPQMGTGGSLLAELVSYIGIGRHAEMLGQPAHEDEWRKQITAKLDAGASMVTIDNVDDPLTSSNLSRALTARTWTDRRLGRSEAITLAQRATWLATGNNIELGGDIARRCFHIRLDAKQSRPWERDGFLHPDLMAWVESHRGELVHALLTIARSWYAAGCPKDDSLPRLGSFESWAETVGGMLAHAGVQGFLSNLDELYENADSETEEWTGFLETWQSKLGEKALAAKILAEEWVLRDDEFKTALPSDLATTLDNGTANFSRALGNALKKAAGRRHGPRGLYVHKHGTYKHAVKWKVSGSRPPNGESGESGESLQPQRGSKSEKENWYARENESAVGEIDSRNSLDSPPVSFSASSEDGAISLEELNHRRESSSENEENELWQERQKDIDRGLDDTDNLTSEEWL